MVTQEKLSFGIIILKTRLLESVINLSQINTLIGSYKEESRSPNERRAGLLAFWYFSEEDFQAH